METITSRDYKKALEELGVCYLGKWSQSAKMVKTEIVGNEITYALYLAPANMSGYEVCPNSARCREFCLNNAGRNKGDIIMRGMEHSKINVSRIKKTRLFFENKPLFMDLLIYELNKAREHAMANGMAFSVRLNCTSDISPLAFVKDGQNILDIFNDVMFYDYTKVPTRLEVAKRYNNYDITFSHDGGNWEMCEKFLKEGINVAVVFESNIVPIAYKGYRVIDMTKTDLRYRDAKSNDGEGFVGFLEYHRVSGDYQNGKYVRPNTPFIIREDDPCVTYEFHTANENEE